MSDRPAKHLHQDEWRRREELFLQFEDAWQHAPSPPDIAGFVSNADRDNPEVVLELVRIDLEYRPPAQPRQAFQDYGQRFPVLIGSPQYTTNLVQALLEAAASHQALGSPDQWRATFQEHRATIDAFFDKLDGTPRAPGTSSTNTRATPTIEGYQIAECIGKGTFATVYRARDTNLDRPVAIKIPHDFLLDDPASRERILREARAVAQLKHAAIVPIYEVRSSDGVLFIISELIEGASLREVIEQKAFSTTDALTWIAGIARALDFAHRRGIIHRDIKPANILIRQHPSPDALLTDFGLARQLGSETLTADGDLLGTPAYMSPEQARGAHDLVDGRSDLYSLGAILYELLSGRLPLDGSVSSILQRVETERPPAPRLADASIPRDVETICLKCLEKDPHDRYQTTGELADDIERFLAGKPIHARPASLAERGWKWARRHPARATVALVGLILLGFATGLLSQLSSTVRQRDLARQAETRAQSAEQQARQLLAKSYLDAAQITMQRGQFRDALTLLESSLEIDAANAIDLNLQRVKCLTILRDFDQARGLLTDMDNVADGDSKLLPHQRGQLQLWKGELALLGGMAGTPLAYYRSAAQAELAGADASYVQGMLSDNSEAALQQFDASLGADPFHHRARVMKVNVLVALGMLDSAEFEVTVGRQLFPEDPYFPLMERFIAAARGDPLGETEMDRIAIDRPTMDAWLEAYRTIDDLVQILSDRKTLDQDAGLSLAARVEQSAEEFQIVASFGWQLPPQIGAKVRDLLATCGSLSNDRLDIAREAVDDLLASHHEGTLLILKGEFLLASEEYALARDCFVEASQTPSLLRNHRVAASKGVVVPAALLGLVNGIELQHNLNIAIEALNGIDANGDFDLGTSRLFTQVAIAAGDVDLTRRWLSVWETHVDPDDYQYLRHQVEFTLMERRRFDALELLHTLRQLFPDDEYAREKEAALVAEVRGNTPQLRGETR